jgi:hypothetical protein
MGAVLLMGTLALATGRWGRRAPAGGLLSASAATADAKNAWPETTDLFVVGQGGPYTPSPEEVTWRYDPVNGIPLGIRPEPYITKPWTETELKKGEVFNVSQILRGIDGVKYLKLADNRGWVFEYKPGVGIMCVPVDAKKKVFAPGKPKPGSGVHALQPNPLFQDPVFSCSDPGKDCRKTRCCKNYARSCYEKDQYWAACRRKCDKGSNDTQLKGWSCKKLVRHVQSPALASVPGGQPGVAGTSLFCITVVMPNSTEVAIVAEQQSRKIGVFGCEESWWINGAPAQATWQAKWKSIANTNVFINVWRQVQYDGRFRNYDWTVKADPDTVFFPDRLRTHLTGLRPPAHTPLYMKNCDFKYGFMGSLEILSTMAVEGYVQNLDDCISHQGTDGGEDFFLMTCLASIGIGHMQDTKLLNDRYDFKKYPGTLFMNSTTDCHNGWVVAFHPHKNVNYWNRCHAAALQAQEQFKESAQRRLNDKLHE